MEDKFIVVDQYTDGVLCESISVTVAHAVAKGFINSAVKILPTSIPTLTERFNKNFNDPDVFYQHRNANIFPMKMEFVNDEFRNFKQLARLRNNFQQAWETRCKQFLYYRNHDYFGYDYLGGFIWKEIQECKPEDNIFTSSIIEWASLTDVDYYTAYQELKMKFESLGRQYLRNLAVYESYVIKLNQQHTYNDMITVLNQGIDYLIGRDLL